MPSDARGVAIVLVLAACTARGGDDEGAASDVTASSDVAGTTTDTSDSGGPTTSAGFYPEPDMLLTNCDPWLQDCPAGEKCVPYTEASGYINRCVPIMGGQTTGEPCTLAGVGSDDCDASGVCWDGTCHAFCMGSADDPSCPEASFCRLTSETAINLCIPYCNPLTQDCDASEGCYWIAENLVCVPTVSEVPPGAPCGYINNCEPGSHCVDGGALPSCMESTCCSSFCNVELGPAPCDAMPGTACVPLWPQGRAPAGFAHVGLCTLP